MEAIVFTKAPLLSLENAAGLESMSRGVRNATIYERQILKDREVLSFPRESLKAGEEARLIDHLPTKMAVFDRRVALLALPGEDHRASSVPVVVHDAGLAETLAAAFDRLWEQAQPLSLKELRRHWTASADDAAS